MDKIKVLILMKQKIYLKIKKQQLKKKAIKLLILIEI